MKLAILTFHRAYNCGAMLQAWALQNMLKKLGHEAVFPDCNTVGEPPFFNITFTRKGLLGKIRNFIGWLWCIERFRFGIYELQVVRFRAFMNAHLCHRPTTAQNLATHCDGVIVGSDQIWNPAIAKCDTGLFLTTIVPQKLPRISYAASIGDRELSADDKSTLKEAAANFDALSIRETLTGEGLLDKQGRPADLVCDPTLLLTAQDYAAITPDKRPCKEPYLLVYTIACYPHLNEHIQHLCSELGIRPIIIDPYGSRVKRYDGTTLHCISPDLFLAYFKNADYIIATSFHGTVFSILFNKPFLSLHQGNPQSRQATLIRTLKCESHLITNETPISEWRSRMLSPLTPETFEALDTFREHSRAWLKHAIDELH